MEEGRCASKYDEEEAPWQIWYAVLFVHGKAVPVVNTDQPQQLKPGRNHQGVNPEIFVVCIEQLQRHTGSDQMVLIQNLLLAVEMGKTAMLSLQGCKSLWQIISVHLKVSYLLPKIQTCSSHSLCCSVISSFPQECTSVNYCIWTFKQLIKGAVWANIITCFGPYTCQRVQGGPKQTHDISTQRKSDTEASAERNWEMRCEASGQTRGENK